MGRVKKNGSVDNSDIRMYIRGSGNRGSAKGPFTCKNLSIIY